MKTVNSFSEAITLALKKKNVGSLNANFSISVEEETWDVYEVAISHRDILCFSDKGTATFLVDTYGTRSVAELFDWERD